jgi:hypothetical protein
MPDFTDCGRHSGIEFGIQARESIQNGEFETCRTRSRLVLRESVFNYGSADYQNRFKSMPAMN